MNQEKNLLLNVLNDTFSQSTLTDLEKNYLKKVSGIKKWTCYSDYCFDDNTKPNDVVCFTLIPYVDDFEKLSQYIATIAQVDIKKTRKVKPEFIAFLKNYPLINISYVFDNKKKIFGKTTEMVQESLKETFIGIKQQIIIWKKNQPDKIVYYDGFIKKLDNVIQLITNNKKIKQIVNMVLVTFLGAYASSVIVKKEEIEIFGWFSDRDAINEVCDGLSVDLFHYYIYGLTENQQFKFVVSHAKSTDNAFYEELVRIPDYVAGALADYNMQNDNITKDKFDTMLTNYMAENVENNFVYQIFTENGLSSARISLHKKDI